MTKKTKSPAPLPGRDSSTSDRVTWLLKNVWNDNRSAMARDVGVTHSVIIKVAAGQQNPGRRLIGAIASHPKVNPAWLLTGEGEPLLSENPAAPTEGWPVPIFNHLIVGSPGENRSLWRGESFPVPGSLYRQTRYWLRVLMTDPIVKQPHLGIRPGDLLLMETDPAWWKTEAMLDDHICSVKIGASTVAQLGMVSFYSETDEEGERFIVEAFKKRPDPSKLSGKSDRPMNPIFPDEDEIELRNVTAACVLLVRRYPSG